MLISLCRRDRAAVSMIHDLTESIQPDASLATTQARSIANLLGSTDSRYHNGDDFLKVECNNAMSHRVALRVYV